MGEAVNWETVANTYRQMLLSLKDSMREQAVRVRAFDETGGQISNVSASEYFNGRVNYIERNLAVVEDFKAGRRASRTENGDNQ